MAIFALLLKRAVVRIGVARGARSEIHVLEASRTAGHIGFMTRLAFYLLVQTGKRISRLRVIELLGSLPIHNVMTALAILSELALVNVFVACRALLRETNIRLRQIFALQQRLELWSDVRGRMALLARDGGVLTLQRVTGQFVVEVLLRLFPMNQRKIGAVVFQMAAYTVSAVRILHAQLGVIPPILREKFGDFLVAVQAVKSRRFCSKLMAAGAL